MDLEQAADELYGADLDEFVSERSRLAKELRDNGRRDDAQALAAFRKPSLPAWVLNQLARRNRRDVDLLLDAGHHLLEAQAKVLSGAEHDSFERARTTEREALDRLTRDAEELLREQGGASAGTINQIRESLNVAAISEDGRELLARGRFVKPMGAQGFDVVAQLASTESRGPLPWPKPAVDREAERQAKAALRDAKKQRRAAERDAREAEREAERRRAEADDAARRAEEARAKAEAAVRRVEELETQLRSDPR